MPRPPSSNFSGSDLLCIEEALSVKRAEIVKLLDDQQELYVKTLVGLCSVVGSREATLEASSSYPDEVLQLEKATAVTFQEERAPLMRDPSANGSLVSEKLVNGTKLTNNGQQPRLLHGASGFLHCGETGMPEEECVVQQAEEDREAESAPLDDSCHHDKSNPLAAVKNLEAATIAELEKFNPLHQQPKDTRVSSLHNVLAEESTHVDERSWSEQMVSSAPFEMTFGILIVLNTVAMCAEAEHDGRDVGNDIGANHADAGNDGTRSVFIVVEVLFCIAFAFEVIMKLVAKRTHFLTSVWDMFDLTIVVLSWINLLAKNVNLFVNPLLFRLVRLIRLLRLVRAVGAFEIFDSLHLMIRGIRASAQVLIWVVALIFPLLSSFALGLNYSLVDFIVDESKPLGTRLICYDYFGTYTKALLSMFEITFANWVPICRFMTEEVAEGFSVFFMGYKLVVGVAVIRIIYGVFLHVTFSCANNDDEALIMKKKREMKKYAEKMQALFVELDLSHDGFLTREEFRHVGQDPRVKHWLAAMDLEIRDAEFVYDLLDNGDDRMSAKEMVYGFSRLKGTARSIDIMALISLTRKALKKLDDMCEQGFQKE